MKFKASVLKTAVLEKNTTIQGNAIMTRRPPDKELSMGLPSVLKKNIEFLSGISMDDVKVHYHSDKPSRMQAQAYAQGSNIYVAAGAERYLSHEAWHIVQQKQGRVPTTMQLSNGTNVNDDIWLEMEADIMGALANIKLSSSIATQLMWRKTRVGRGLKKVYSLKNDHVVQRVTIYQARDWERPVWEKYLFQQRVIDGTATTGAHNYAIEFSKNKIVRSNTSAHAEIMLIATSDAQKNDEILLISEYKPCPSCQKAIQEIEVERGVSVRILYLLPYEAKGDGDKDLTRDYYKGLGFLSGGGKYVYQVTFPK